MDHYLFFKTTKHEKRMFIDCIECKGKVSADLLASEENLPNGERDGYAIYFLKCPICEMLMIGEADYEFQDYGEYSFSSHLRRLWPSPKKEIDRSIPKLVRNSIEEAQRCFDADAFSACAVMCGRSLEALCKEHGYKEVTLMVGLKELKNTGFIDGRLYNWSESLRNLRNIGAHASDELISREDTRDILDFTLAICEYVYVLSDKYNRFVAREAARKKK
ncbi:DUF4145 domain-containing protein [Leptospira santarosai]|uniref:DUF4145 domain-containing protein n=1 Tax=Leptospira santarosai TaxID=28183 RepID=UPI001E4E4A23|nr:DUF4145 domain-containing protein [Leptospira santarosai]